VNLVADESVDGPIVYRLRAEGHTVLYVAEFAAGIPDTEVLGLANGRRSLLITSDKDFGELVFRQRRVAEGVILLRLAGETAQRKADVVSQALRDRGEEVRGAFTVVTGKAVRIRRRLE
jgi:predicted nuclease of predicted toxin-antitoxin system